MQHHQHIERMRQEDIQRHEMKTLRAQIRQANWTEEERSEHQHRDALQAQIRRANWTEEERSEHQHRDALQAQIQRANWTEEERSEHQHSNVLQAQIRRANWTEEERSEHQHRDALQAQIRRANWMEEERSEHQHSDVLQAQIRRANWTEEERSEHQHRDALQAQIRRANWTEEERSEHQHRDALQAQIRRANQNEEQRAQTRQHHAHQEHDRVSHMTEEARAQATQHHSQQSQILRSNLTQEQREEMQRRRNELARQHQEEDPPTYRQARKPIIDETTVISHSCGRREFVCPHCHALKWKEEKTLHKLCCNSGKSCNVGLLFPDAFPQPLQDLLRYDVSNQQSPPIPITVIKKFRASLRHYNCSLQMASYFGVVQKPPSGGQSLMIIHGSVHHCLGSLLPRDGDRPRFMQMFFIDDIQEQVNCRMLQLGGEEGGLDRDLLLKLQTMLHDHNHFVHQFKQLVDEIEEGEVADFTIHITNQGQVDRRYNVPTGQGEREVATVIPGNARDANVSEGRSIQLRVRGGGLHYISDCHPWFDGLHFVLLHPQGQNGWSPKSIRLRLPESPPVQQETSVEDSAQQQGDQPASEGPNASNDIEAYFSDDEEDNHIEHTNERRHINHLRPY